MKYLVSGHEMQQYDKNTTEYFKVPSLLLMECAASSLTGVIRQKISRADRILIVCGTGNNGADGLACARQLLLSGYQADVFIAGNPAKTSSQFQTQMEIYHAYGFSLLDNFPEHQAYDMVVDAIFGVGLSRAITGVLSEILEKMNAMPGRKLAVDMPSGISADTGEILGIAFHADLTVTFSFEKRGMYLWPGSQYVGEVVCPQIGITEKSFLDKKPQACALTPEDLRTLPERPAHSNKGTFGKLLLIAGSTDMAGAAVLSARAACVSGCGLVRVFTPETNRIILQTSVPDAILTTYTENTAIEEELREAVNWADAIVCGPGLGTKPPAGQIVDQVLKEASVPVVFDADALNLIAQSSTRLNECRADVIITPHPGEMGRLLQKPVAEITGRLLQTAEAFAREHRLICVLKDAHTVTALPDGSIYLNLSGNNGMATAGSGDVLSGITGSLLAQGISAADAAPMAVYLHGTAGDRMLNERGYRGMTAGDLITGLCRIFAEEQL